MHYTSMWAQAALCILCLQLVVAGGSWRRTETDELLDAEIVNKRCDWPQFQGSEFAGTAKCFAWLKDKDATHEYLKPAKQLGLDPVNASKPLIVHTTWGGDLANNKLQFMIASFMYTQVRPPPAQQVELWVWHIPQQGSTDRPLPPKELPLQWNRISVAHTPRHYLCPNIIKFKRFHIGTIMSSLPRDMWSPLAQEWLYKNSSSDEERILKLEHGFSYFHNQDFTAVSYADLVRFTVLSAFGGLYLDTDCQILRDLRPLQIQSFWYRWETNPNANTAIMYAGHNTDNIRKLFRHLLWTAISRDSDTGEIRVTPPHCHPWEIVDNAEEVRKQDKSFTIPTMMATTLFNALWPNAANHDEEQGYWPLPTWHNFHFDYTPDARPENVDTFLEGAYVNHFHNQYKESFKDGTWGRAFEDAYRLYLTRRRRNAYGELWDWNACYEKP